MGATRLKVRRISRAEARHSLFFSSLLHRLHSRMFPGPGIKHPVYSACRRPPSLLTGFLAYPVLFGFVFCSVHFLICIALLSALLQYPYYRILQLAFKGDFALVQRSSLGLSNINNNNNNKQPQQKTVKILLVHFSLETSDQCTGSRKLGRCSSVGMTKGG